MTDIWDLIWSSILAYSIIQGLLLFLIFPTFRKGSKQAKQILASLSLLSAILVAEEFTSTAFGLEQYPHLIFAFGPFWYLLSPLLFFYIRLHAQGRAVRWIDSWHFLPMLILVIDSADFYMLPAEVKLYYLQHHVQQGQIHPIHQINYIIFCVQSIGYLSFCWIMLRKAAIDIRQRAEYRWLQQLVLTLGILCLLSCFSIFALSHVSAMSWAGPLYALVVTGFVLALFLRSIRFPKTLYMIGRPPFISSDSDSNEQYEKLLEYLRHEQPFSDPSFDIQALSNSQGISKHRITQLIRQHTQLSFRDFVNSLRIEEAKRRLSSHDNKQYTIETIANDSGFASLATFYRVFKKIEGQTPKSFIPR